MLQQQWRTACSAAAATTNCKLLLFCALHATIIICSQLQDRNVTQLGAQSTLPLLIGRFNMGAISSRTL
jgi:hypothetical protein